MAIGRTFDARIKYEQFYLIMSFFNEFPVRSFFFLFITGMLLCWPWAMATILLSLTYFWIKFGHLLSLVLIYLRFPSFFLFRPEKCQPKWFSLFYLGELEPKLPAILWMLTFSQCSRSASYTMLEQTKHFHFMRCNKNGDTPTKTHQILRPCSYIFRLFQ